jgi:hypothetical protein
LIEVTSISDLPKGLKFHVNGWLGQRNEKIGPPSEDDDPGDRPGRFIIAGVSSTSALVAYEMYGYVPTTHATACVHAKSDWIVAKKVGRRWVSEDFERIADVERFAKPVTGR